MANLQNSFERSHSIAFARFRFFRLKQFLRHPFNKSKRYFSISDLKSAIEIQRFLDKIVRSDFYRY